MEHTWAETQGSCWTPRDVVDIGSSACDFGQVQKLEEKLAPLILKIDVCLAQEKDDPVEGGVFADLPASSYQQVLLTATK